MKDHEITSTNITRTYKNELKKLARTWGKPQIRILEEMIYSFKITGTNPAKVDTYSPKKEITNLTTEVKKIIGFIVTNEKEKITPLLDEINILSRSIAKNIEYSITKDDLNQIQSDTNDANEKLNKVIDVIKALLKHLEHENDKSLAKIDECLTIEKRNSIMLELLFEAITTKTITGGVKPSIIDKYNKLKN